MNILWVDIRSQHALAAELTASVSLKTECGRFPDSGATVHDALDPRKKTCETCLRIIARRADEPLPEDGDVGE